MAEPGSGDYSAQMIAPAVSHKAKVTLALMAALAATTVLGAAEGTRPPRDLDALLARFVEARGGAGAMRAVRTVRLSGRFIAGDSGVATIELARDPARVHTEIRFGSRALIQVWDGHAGWTINPFRGDSVARPLEGGEAKNVAAGADFEGPLVDWRAKGDRVRWAGADTADGRPAYAVEVFTADSLHDTYFIDSHSFLQTKWEGHRELGGDSVTFVSYFRDYRMVGGMAWAYRIDSQTLGRPGGQQFVFDSVSVNVPLPTATFAKPVNGGARPGK